MHVHVHMQSDCMFDQKTVMLLVQIRLNKSINIYPNSILRLNLKRDILTAWRCIHLNMQVHTHMHLLDLQNIHIHIHIHSKSCFFIQGSC